MTKPKHAWMIRAGNDNELASLLEKANVVAVGWDAMGDLSGLKTREQFKESYIEAYPDHSLGRVNVNNGQIYRFVRDIKESDYALTYLKDSREILIGLVTGSYEYKPNLFDDLSQEYPQIRPVQWLKRVSRDDFSAAARNSMGSTLTIFNLDDHLLEIHQAVTSETITPLPDDADESPPFFEDVSEKAKELIADLVSRLDPYDFQNLVAAVLRAMGYRAVSSKPGRDRGIDVIAHPDALKLGRPRIKGQVKHRTSAATGEEMRSFLGTLRSGDNGLYVSTGGFTSDARLEASQAHAPVTIMDRDEFIELMLEYYEHLEPEFQAKVPLRKVWLPTE
jgi:restriction system protein